MAVISMVRYLALPLTKALSAAPTFWASAAPARRPTTVPSASPAKTGRMVAGSEP
ncbi:hypothetical protein D3C86_2110180 [compost metagenome]